MIFVCFTRPLTTTCCSCSRSTSMSGKLVQLFRVLFVSYPCTLIRCPPATQVNIVDYDGRTPLGIAASQGNVEAVRYLLAHGANHSIKDIRYASACLGDDHYSQVADLYCRGNTPFEDAKREKRDSVVKLLGKRQASSRIFAFKFVAFLK
jgi:hypothetical protein